MHSGGLRWFLAPSTVWTVGHQHLGMTPKAWLGTRCGCPRLCPFQPHSDLYSTAAVVVFPKVPPQGSCTPPPS